MSVISSIYLLIEKQTDLTTGIGACAGDTTPDPKASYCSGTECNSFSGRTCWDPKSGGANNKICSADTYQCKVYAHRLI
jgi:hypothetical protein